MSKVEPLSLAGFADVCHLHPIQGVLHVQAHVTVAILVEGYGSTGVFHCGNTALAQKWGNVQVTHRISDIVQLNKTCEREERVNITQ